MPSNNDPFRLNLGYFINQSVGYSRDFLFDLPQVQLPPDLNLRDLNGHVQVTRTPQGLLVQVKMQATLSEKCVRCLTGFQQRLDVDFTELYAFSSDSMTDSGLVLPETATISLGNLLREFMLLEVPINPICKSDCKGLCPTCGNNLNESTCNHEPEQVDPRLSVLRTLLQEE